MKKKNIFSALIVLLACLFCGFSVRGVSASAQDASAVRIDFSDASTYVETGTLVGLAEGASFGVSTSVETTETFTSFLLYVDVKSVAGDSLVISFGEHSLRIYADGVISSQMQLTEAGRKFSFEEIANGGVIMVEYIGGRVFVGMSSDDQPSALRETPIACYDAEGQAPCSIKVTTDENTVLSVKSLRIYTLAPTIDIQPDNWEEGDMDRPIKNAPDVEEAEEGCGSVLSYASVALCGLMIAGAVSISKKKEREDEENEMV